MLAHEPGTQTGRQRSSMANAPLSHNSSSSSKRQPPCHCDLNDDTLSTAFSQENTSNYDLLTFLAIFCLRITSILFILGNVNSSSNYGSAGFSVVLLGTTFLVSGFGMCFGTVFKEVRTLRLLKYWARRVLKQWIRSIGLGSGGDTERTFIYA